VQSPGNRKKVEPEVLFQQCRELLAENEYPDPLVQVRQIESSDIAKAITAQAEDGKFAVVAVGRSGSGGCSLRDMFLGSVSFGLFKELSGSVLWVHR
jgi:nucleotide-binding universal stress UspA family protein